MDTRQELVNNIINLMENGVEKWREPFKRMDIIFPYNPISGTKYSSYNFLLLMSATKKVELNNTIITSNEYFNDPRWCTFIQAKNSGYKINKGAIATPIYFFDYQRGIKYESGEKIAIFSKSDGDYIRKVQKIIDKKLLMQQSSITTVDIADKYIDICSKIMDKNVSKDILKDFILEVSQKTKIEVEYTGIFILQKHSLFNFSQMSNIPEIDYIKPKFEPIERVENILKNSGAMIIHDNFNTMNYYVPSSHEIHLVPKYLFHNENSYYATVMHELAHWTLGVGVKRNYGDLDLSNYPMRAKEELRAEFSSLFTCAEIGLKYDLDNHASYIQSWIKILKEQPQELFLAVQDANRITAHIKEYDRTLIQNLSHKNLNQDFHNELEHD